MRQATRKICEHLAIASVAALAAVIALWCMQDITTAYDPEIASSFAKIAAKAPRIDR